MEKKRNKINLRKKIPTTAELTDRFLFIEDEILRENVVITFQYLIFLIAILDDLEADNTTISSSIHKDMIVYTGSIIESILHYCLKQYIDNDLIRSHEAMSTKWDMRDHKVLYEISNTEKVCGAIKYKKTERLTDQTNFIVINRACKKAGILTNILFDKSEEVRNLRNKIHLSGLRLVDNSYSKDDSQAVFDTAKKVIEKVEERLLKIK